MKSEIYFRQLLAGRDFAQDSPIAAQMVNFVYLLGDPIRRKCVVVDPAWDVDGILDVVDADGMELVGALTTHYHPDHVGGGMLGIEIEGLAALLSRRPVKVHANKLEADGIKQVTGLSESDLVRHEGSDRLDVGDLQIELIHTPGHTPGSQCFLADGKLVSGDTLFVQGCGRVDLPGGNAADLYESLTQRLSKLPDETVLYPGHDYSWAPASTMGEQKRINTCMRVRSLDEWLGLMT